MPCHLRREEIVTMEVVAEKQESKRRIARTLGVTEGTVRYHLRRLATWAADPSFPLFKVQLWAGHSSIRTTQGYVHLDDAPPSGPPGNVSPVCHQPKKP